jgi:hypothetical protein
MKHINKLALALSLAFSCSYATPVLASVAIPQEIIDFATKKGLVLGKVAAPIASKYLLENKQVDVAGKLVVSGKVVFQGHTVPFSAPGTNNAIWRTHYSFGKKRPNGSIPFKFNQLQGSFDGIMIPTKADTYTLKLLNPQGSLLSGLATAGQKSGTGLWKNTQYSYTAVVSQKNVNGVIKRYFAVKEQASFNFNLLAFNGAIANYTYSYDWNGIVK